MSFLEDLFEGRRGGHHGGYYRHDGHGHDDEHWGRREGGNDPRLAPVDARGPQVQCGQCRAPVVVLPGFRFCPYCGGPLAASTACPGCGATRAPGAAFCAACGAKF